MLIFPKKKKKTAKRYKGTFKPNPPLNVLLFENLFQNIAPLFGEDARRQKTDSRFLH